MAYTALVLEGGGTRAVYTSGVLDAFMEHGIKFPYVIGVSAGSCNATSYLAVNIKRQHDITINYTDDKRYMGVRNMIENGNFLNLDWIFGELAYDVLPLNHDAFENSGARLAVVTTDAESGEVRYYYPTSFREECQVLKASCAMPMATKGVEYDSRVLFDGGITDSIPFQKALDDGADKVVVVLTQDMSYVKKPFPRPNVVRRALHRYPQLAEALINRSIMYNNQTVQLKKLEEEGKALVIRPSEPLNCPSLEKNKDKLEKIYTLGYTDSIEMIEKVNDFIID